MKKLNAVILSLIVIGVCSLNGASAVEFSPLNFDNPTYTKSDSQKIASADKSYTTTSKTSTAVKPTETTGSQSMQGAISQLDNAQVEVRNELLNYRTQYAEIDAKYEKVKLERSNLSKQIRACEKKINQLDKAKEKIRKNMI